MSTLFDQEPTGTKFEDHVTDPVEIEAGDLLGNVSDQDDTGTVQEPQPEQKSDQKASEQAGGPKQSGPEQPGPEQPGQQQSGPQPGSQSTQVPGQDGKISLAQIIPAGTGVEILDAAIKRGEKLGVYLSGYEPYPSFALTKQEKEILIPTMQRCLDSVKINIQNPWYQLAIMMGGMISAKAMFSKWEKVTPKKEKPQDKTHVAGRSDKGRKRGPYKKREQK